MTLYICREVDGLNCCSFEVVPILEATSWTFEFAQESSKNTDGVDYSFTLRCGHGDNEYTMFEFMLDESRLSDIKILQGLRKVTSAISTQLTTNRYLGFDELIQIFLHKPEDRCT